MSERIENGLITKTAIEVVGLLRRGDVSSLELLDAFEHHIEAVDRAVGALPTLCIDRSRDRTHLREVGYVGVPGK